MANFHTRTVLIVMGTLMAISSTAQAGNSKNFSKQFSLITENDRYLLQGNDRYYTNGIMLNYSLIQHSEKPQLRVAQIDHPAFGTSELAVRSLHDCGWLPSSRRSIVMAPGDGQTR